MEINEMVQLAHGNAVNHGWWENPPSMPELLMLIITEAAEAMEEYRNGKDPKEIYYSGKKTFQSEVDTNGSVIYSVTSNLKDHEINVPSIGVIKASKPEGIPSELADIVIRVSDICGRYGIDLEAAIKEKMEYNKNRPYKHGGKKL